MIVNTFANICDISSTHVGCDLCKGQQLRFCELLGIPLEYKKPIVLIWECEIDRKVDTTEHGLIEILLPIGGANKKDIGMRLEAVDFPQESGQDSATGLVHLVAPLCRDGVYFIDEDDAFAEGLRTGLEKVAEFMFAFAIVFAHYAFQRHIYQRNTHLLGYYLRRRCLPASRRPLE